jgi:CubicO group peptidase (beta-lactamase class C family)
LPLLEDYLKKLIQKKELPGITVALADDSGILFEKYLGCCSVEPVKKQLKKGTVYDLASVSKPLITALLLLKIFENEKLKLDMKVSRFFPIFNKGVEVIDLLTHTSGLPDWYPLYLQDQDYLQTIMEMKLLSRPKKKVNYSCLGYILLFFLVEKITGRRFRDLVVEEIFEPLGLNHTFLSGDGEKPKELEIAPTEIGNEFEKQKCMIMFPKKAFNFDWREGLICGQTHDCNSFYQGGFAGNAGLFTNTADLVRLLREIYPESTTVLKPKTAELFWFDFTGNKKSHRTAGFKLNNSIFSSGGRALENNAIGHNGFTGTSVWLERKSGLRYIILTNRVHPRVDASTNFNSIRRKIHRYLKNRLSKK